MTVKLNRLSANDCVYVQVHQLDLPVQRNQVLIIKHFSMMREEIEFCRKFLGEGKKKKCMDLLHKKVRMHITCVIHQDGIIFTAEVEEVCATLSFNRHAESFTCTLFVIMVS